MTFLVLTDSRNYNLEHRFAIKTILVHYPTAVLPVTHPNLGGVYRGEGPTQGGLPVY